MNRLARVATWIDGVLTVFIGVVLRGVTASLAFVLRRGKHRAWRRRARPRHEEPRL